MTENAVKSQTGWYARPVLFVADVKRALRFYVDVLGFEKRWHEGDGTGERFSIEAWHPRALTQAFGPWGNSMNAMAKDEVETDAWLLSGITGNLPGILSLAGGRFAFVADDGQVVFDAPVSDVRGVKVPWYYFGGGMKLSVGSERYRLSFVRPTAAGGGAADIPEGRRACKLWRSLLEPSSSAKG